MADLYTMNAELPDLFDLLPLRKANRVDDKCPVLDG